jgi:peptidoglycan/xylan/chitin deacetylase (PgdA/CDA1 family)
MLSKVENRTGQKPAVGLIGAPDGIYRAVDALNDGSVAIMIFATERNRAKMQTVLATEGGREIRFESAESVSAAELCELDVLVNTSPSLDPLLFTAVSRSIPLVSLKFDELSSLFPARSCVLYFSSYDELQRLIFAFLNDPDKRDAFASAALNRLLRDYPTRYFTRDYQGIAYSFSRARPGLTREILSSLFPRSLLVMRGDPKRQEFSITFDDGPDPVFTLETLEILRDFDVRATFYLVGNRAEQFPEIVQKIAADGHEIGSHSYTHPLFRRISWHRAKHELAAAERAIRDAGVEVSQQLRPPFGDLSLKSLLSAWIRGLTVVGWSLDLKDYAARSTEDIINQLQVSGIRDGDIVLYHAINRSGVAALPTVLEYLTRNGRKGVTVSRLVRP